MTIHLKPRRILPTTYYRTAFRRNDGVVNSNFIAYVRLQICIARLALFIIFKYSLYLQLIQVYTCRRIMYLTLIFYPLLHKKQDYCFRTMKHKRNFTDVLNIWKFEPAFENKNLFVQNVLTKAAIYKREQRKKRKKIYRILQKQQYLVKNIKNSLIHSRRLRTKTKLRSKIYANLKKLAFRIRQMCIRKMQNIYRTIPRRKAIKRLTKQKQYLARQIIYSRYVAWNALRAIIKKFYELDYRLYMKPIVSGLVGRTGRNEFQLYIKKVYYKIRNSLVIFDMFTLFYFGLKKYDISFFILFYYWYIAGDVSHTRHLNNIKELLSRLLSIHDNILGVKLIATGTFNRHSRSKTYFFEQGTRVKSTTHNAHILYDTFEYPLAFGAYSVHLWITLES